MTKIILTRHGHVEGIEPERFRGRTNIPLTELGKAQAKATAARIAGTWKLSMVYTSPMLRCVVTGQEISTACHIPGDIAESLNDIDYGTWQWQTHEEVRKSSFMIGRSSRSWSSISGPSTLTAATIRRAPTHFQRSTTTPAIPLSDRGSFSRFHQGWEACLRSGRRQTRPRAT
jgi:phosphoserine phosphatase